MDIIKAIFWIIIALIGINIFLNIIDFFINNIGLIITIIIFIIILLILFDHSKDNNEKRERGELAQEYREKIEREKLARQKHRDADYQEKPYEYQIGKHANQTLAIRYGIANQKRKIKEFYDYAKGGNRQRNPDRDKVFYTDARTILLQKTKMIRKDLYEAMLSDYKNRKIRVVIEPGTEYVKSFYPPTDDWFEKHKDLEQALKDNPTFTLKELARFHVEKTVGR